MLEGRRPPAPRLEGQAPLLPPCSRVYGVHWRCIVSDVMRRDLSVTCVRRWPGAGRGAAGCLLPSHLAAALFDPGAERKRSLIAERATGTVVQRFLSAPAALCTAFEVGRPKRPTGLCQRRVDRLV